MKRDIINRLHARFEEYAHDEQGVEYWLARDLQDLLGYTQWRNFLQVVEKAKIACEQAGQRVQDHFADVSKMVDLGSGSQRDIDDIALTRYACYLIAQNGDDFLPTITIKAKDFANEITNFNIKKDDLSTEPQITMEQNNTDVRQLLTDRGIHPEELPPAEDVKKLERRVQADEKEITKEIATTAEFPSDNEDTE